jgi:ABC-type nitrate/sulfonate/bicarbonate transport system substrate-binding protein
VPFRQEIRVPIARPRSYDDPAIFELSRDVIRAFGEEINREPKLPVAPTSEPSLVDNLDRSTVARMNIWSCEQLGGATMLSRLGILVIAMLSACGSASAQVKVRIGDLAQSLNEIASRVMIDQGIDRKYGIAAEYRAYPTLDGLFTAIRGKDVDVGFGGWTAIAQFRGKGFPVTMVFPVGRGVTVDVIVPAASPIKSIADLKGKKVGTFVGAAGTATMLFR